MDTQKKKDIELEETEEYEVPDPPSLLRIKENEAYGIFPN